MDANKTEGGPEQRSGERPLPRGLEHVSHVFLSHTQAGRALQEPIQNASSQPANTKPEDQSLTVVLRPCRFSAREQLVSLLKQQTAALEEGMKAIDASIPCETSGSIELLAVDGKNQLAIIDLDDHPDDGLLLRGIDHFDWIVRNAPNVRRMYQGQVIDFSVQPRLFLVAPEFSPLFRSVTRNITSLQINCLKYHAIALSGGVGIFFEQVFSSGFQETKSTELK